jgi:hypothetical protein
VTAAYTDDEVWALLEALDRLADAVPCAPPIPEAPAAPTLR